MPGVRVSLGIATMTKQPSELPTWLHYHHQRLGVCRFFIHVEDTPQLATLFATPPWDRLVVASYAEQTQRDYFAQMDRQSSAVAKSIATFAAATSLINRSTQIPSDCSRVSGGSAPPVCIP